MSADDRHLRIAVDAMGGDFAPDNVLAGTLEALRESNNRFGVTLVGPDPVIRERLGKLDATGCDIEVVNAPEVIDMHDGATAALKQKKNSSIAVGMQLHHDGAVGAFVSAGHSGAVMSASTLILGRIEGIGRPTIGAFLPTETGVCLLVDAGANVDCRPQHLYEFGVMGSIYSRTMLGIERPAVALLSIGEEPSKGNETVLGAHELFRKSSLNFIGNVEGRDILKGTANVVVCDGFVGNIILKFAESVPSFFKGRMKQVVSKSAYMKVVGLLVRNTLRAALKSLDYEEYGGVPVLGVNGVTIIGHGKSTPKAIRNMILKAELTVRKEVNSQIQKALAPVQ